MPKMSVREARAHFSQLLDEVEAGEEIEILRRGRVVAKLVKAESKTSGRLPSLKHLRDSIKPKGASLSDIVKENRKEARY